jgi:hypothetical protein
MVPQAVFQGFDRREIREQIMAGVLDRIVEGADGPRLAAGRVALAEVESRIGTGAALDHLAGELGLDAADLVAALAYLALGPEGSEGPPLVQGAPSGRVAAAVLSEPALSRLVPASTRPARLALAAGLLQVHDFWDASHRAAQQADDEGEAVSAAFWHGIAHRREPDSGNASYWFRHVGRHPLLASLAEAAGPLLAAQRTQADAAERLIRGGTWDPFAFITFCGSAPPGSRAEDLARHCQRLEMALLLETSLREALP